jgi:hypothetical protein
MIRWWRWPRSCDGPGGPSFWCTAPDTKRGAGRGSLEIWEKAGTAWFAPDLPGRSAIPTRSNAFNLTRGCPTSVR